ncbi:hypothetical protein EVAR_32700_1 [Eumeta japonica]|uniref:Uncharacterized protein n=1 Tax=Eumeta variegata TaxID=151549 RepID=A0A4C1VQM8_EUMVA|nr:hypothetical protein EVAR_32700_1 [Eumeta japonica]
MYTRYNSKMFEIPLHTFRVLDFYNSRPPREISTTIYSEPPATKDEGALGDHLHQDVIPRMGGCFTLRTDTAFEGKVNKTEIGPKEREIIKDHPALPRGAITLIRVFIRVAFPFGNLTSSEPPGALGGDPSRPHFPFYGPRSHVYRYGVGDRPVAVLPYDSLTLLRATRGDFVANRIAAYPLIM